MFFSFLIFFTATSPNNILTRLWYCFECYYIYHISILNCLQIKKIVFSKFLNKKLYHTLSELTSKMVLPIMSEQNNHQGGWELRLPHVVYVQHAWSLLTMWDLLTYISIVTKKNFRTFLCFKMILWALELTVRFFDSDENQYILKIT